MSFYLNDTYFDTTHPTANISSSNFDGLVGNGMRVLLSNHVNDIRPAVDQRNLGFTLRVLPSPSTENLGSTGFNIDEDGDGWSDGQFGLQLIVSQPPDNYMLTPIVIPNLHFQEWYNVSLTFRFEPTPVVELIVNTQKFSFDLTGIIPDIECFKKGLQLNGNRLTIGAGQYNSAMVDDTGECDQETFNSWTRCRPVIETYIRSFKISSPASAGDTDLINSSLNTLKENIYGNISLSFGQKNSLLESFIQNWDGNFVFKSSAIIN